MITISYVSLAIIVWLAFSVGSFYGKSGTNKTISKNSSDQNDFRQCELTLMLISNCLNELTSIKHNCRSAFQSEHALRALIINPNLFSASKVDNSNIPFLDFLSSSSANIRNPFMLKELISKYNKVIEQWALIIENHKRLSPVLTKCYTEELSINIEKAGLNNAEYKEIYDYIMLLEQGERMSV